MVEARTIIAGILCLLLMCTACNQEPAQERPDAPGTPEEQLEALEEAADEAVAERDFARAEVALEALVELDSSDRNNRLRSRLSIIRKRRKADETLREIERLIELKSFRSARARLDYLDRRKLHEDDAEQVQMLRELLELAEDESGGIDLR